MPLAHDEITAISSGVVRGYPRQPPLEFVAVVASEGGSGRVEVLVTITACHKEPCNLVLNLSRQDRPTLEDELRRKLRRALQKHTASGSDPSVTLRT